MRLPQDLEDVSGLIMPGGESTTMRKLIDRWGLHGPIMRLAASGAPMFGTCAGMIVLSREIAGGEEPVLPLLDVTVERNAFGRQLDSFEAELAVPVLGDRPVHAVFIRAPIVERVGPDVDVLARLDDGRIVAVRERNVSRRRSIPSWPARRGSIGWWPRWPPSTTTRRGLRPAAAPDPAVAPGRMTPRRGGRARVRAT